MIGACWGAGRTQMQTQDTALNEQKPFYWGKQGEKHKTLHLEERPEDQAKVKFLLGGGST